jgi:hypothetical protein
MLDFWLGILDEKSTVSEPMGLTMASIVNPKFQILKQGA